MQLSVNDKIYDKVTFKTENEFEKVVQLLSDKIFGESTIYLDLKRKVKGNNIGVIPDGYLIDMTIVDEPRLYVIENEIVSHDPFKHIGIQMLKFVTSFEEVRTRVRNLIMEEVSKNSVHVERIENHCAQSQSRNIDNYLDKAVYSEFKGLVIIDEAKPELFKVLERINANISVLEIKSFKTAKNEFAYEYDTLYESEDDIMTSPSFKDKEEEASDRLKRRKRRAQCDTIVVPAREDGFQEVFIGKKQWYSIRIGAAMKDRIKYIAAYQVAPISGVTHIAEVQDIKPYEDSGKYIVYFKDSPEEIPKVGFKDPNKSPQGPVYVKYTDLTGNKFLDESLAY